MSPRLRRALRRLFWTGVRIGVRSACWCAARVISRAVDAELAADRAQGLTPGPVTFPLRAVAVQAPAPPVAVDPEAGWAFHPSRREGEWAIWVAAKGFGVYKLTPDVSVAIRNAGRC